MDNSHSSIAAVLRRTVASTNDGVTVVRASSVADLLATPRAQPRLNAIVLVLFALASIVLAAIGLYAIIATRVRQRTQEFGIRMAIGATPGLLGMAVVFRALLLALVGTTIGVAGALLVGRLISALLFGVEPVDWVTLLVAASMVLSVAAIASWIPTRLVIRVNPVIALCREN